MIVKSEGFIGIQKGLVLGLWYQMMMNGFRLGMFQILINFGYIIIFIGEYLIFRNIVVSVVVGGLVMWVGSLFYLVGFLVYCFFFIFVLLDQCSCIFLGFFVGFYFQNRDVRYVYIICWRIECNKLMQYDFKYF